MTRYRAYQLDCIGHFRAVSEFHCASDEDAVSKAQVFGTGFDIGLWDRDRSVMRIDPQTLSRTMD